jgi:hypothetical protein
MLPTKDQFGQLTYVRLPMSAWVISGHSLFGSVRTSAAWLKWMADDLSTNQPALPVVKPQ